MRSAIVAMFAFTGPHTVASAQDDFFFAESVISTAVHDRGEQIGGETWELATGVEIPASFGLVYGSVYLLKPIGQHRQAFDTEVDYSLGVIWEGPGYIADISASWLTFPGEATDSSVEFAAALIFDAPYSPTLSAFYDFRSEDMGLEVSAGPQWAAGAWSLYALGRGGFVHLGADGVDRSYAGLEIGADHALSGSVELGLFARIDTADDQTFASDFRSGTIADVRNSGVSLGVSLLLMH